MKAWIQLLAGPLAWFASLCFSFADVPFACAARSKPQLLAIPIVATLLTIFCGWLAWNDWRRIGRDYPGESGGAVASERALASGGVLLNGFFVIVLVAQIIVPSILGVCE